MEVTIISTFCTYLTQNQQGTKYPKKDAKNLSCSWEGAGGRKDNLNRRMKSKLRGCQ